MAKKARKKSKQPTLPIPNRWFTVADKPRRAGVYRTSREDITHLGSSYGHWDGKAWGGFKNWGNYANKGLSPLVWQGEGRWLRDPVLEIDGIPI